MVIRLLLVGAVPDHRRRALGGASLHGGAHRPGAPLAGHGGAPRSAVAAPRRLGVGQLARLVPAWASRSSWSRPLGQRLDGGSPARELALPPLGRARHAARRRRSARAPGAPVPGGAAQSPGAPRPGHRVAGADVRHDQSTRSSSCSSCSRSCCSLADPRIDPRCSSESFSGAALLGARNLTVASLVMLPVMAASLTDVGSLSSTDRPRAGSDRGAGCRGRGRAADRGPARSARASTWIATPSGRWRTWRRRASTPGRSAWPASTIVGNLVDYVYGPEQRTFYDDRFDMFPEDISEAHLALAQGAPTFRSELDRLDIDLVTAVEHVRRGTGPHRRPRLAGVLRRRRVDPALPARGRPGRRRRELLTRGVRRSQQREEGVSRDAKKGGPCGPPFVQVLVPASCWRRRWRNRSS